MRAVWRARALGWVWGEVGEGRGWRGMIIYGRFGLGLGRVVGCEWPQQGRSRRGIWTGQVGEWAEVGITLGIWCGVSHYCGCDGAAATTKHSHHSHGNACIVCSMRRARCVRAANGMRFWKTEMGWEWVMLLLVKWSTRWLLGRLVAARQVPWRLEWS